MTVRILSPMMLRAAGKKRTHYVPTPSRFLADVIVDWWDSELDVITIGGEVDTWTGQVASTICQAPAPANRCGYAADGSYFGGRAVVQCSTAPRFLTRTSGSDLVAAGARPFTWCVGRLRALHTSGTGRLFDVQGATAQHSIVANSDGAGSDDFAGIFWPGTFVSLVDGQDTVPHLFAMYATASAKFLEMDGSVVATVAGGWTTADALNLIGVGAHQGGGQESNASLAALGICSAVPTATQRAALHAYCQGRWGTP